jgi:hypothetical protein
MTAIETITTLTFADVTILRRLVAQAWDNRTLDEDDTRRLQKELTRVAVNVFTSERWEMQRDR